MTQVPLMANVTFKNAVGWGDAKYYLEKCERAKEWKWKYQSCRLCWWKWKYQSIIWTLSLTRIPGVLEPITVVIGQRNTLVSLSIQHKVDTKANTFPPMSSLASPICWCSQYKHLQSKLCLICYWSSMYQQNSSNSTRHRLYKAAKVALWYLVPTH